MNDFTFDFASEHKRVTEEFYPQCERCTEVRPLVTEYRGTRKVCEECNYRVMEEWAADLKEDRERQGAW